MHIDKKPLLYIQYGSYTYSKISTTMIIEGNYNVIIKAEVAIPTLCHELDLLAIMKRTHHHAKQHLVHLINVDLTAQDIQGLSGVFNVLIIKSNYHRYSSN